MRHPELTEAVCPAQVGRAESVSHLEVRSQADSSCMATQHSRLSLGLLLFCQRIGIPHL